MQLVVGRIGRAHGVTGELAVSVSTDDPAARFGADAVLATEPADRGPLRVTGHRWHSGRLLVTFAGVTDRSAAAALAGTRLLVESAKLPPLADPEEFYDHQLVGLAVADRAGTALGTVADVVHTPGSTLLAIRRPDGAEALVPFVAAIVPTVDVAGGRVVVDPPPGLLEL